MLPRNTAAITRDISYASSARTRTGRAVIRTLEGVTGRGGLIRRARGYEADVAAGADFWQVMIDRYGVGLNVVGGSLDNIPETGPVILVSNHPFGILDGLVMGHILAKRRGDFRILANSVFNRAEDINRIILPISFDATKSAMKLNLNTRAKSLEYLAQGGAIGVFPGGTVSTANRPFGAAMDPGWRNFTAKMIQKSDATVVPIFFDGSNSRLFQLASHLHETLRLGLLIKEFRARIEKPVDLVVGTPIARDILAPFARDPKAMMDFLRKATYELSPTPFESYDYGYEFEAKYRN